MLIFNAVGFLFLTCCFGCKISCRSIPSSWGRLAGLGFEHGGQLCHQHQLAELRRRDDHELLDPDAGLTVQKFLSAATGMAILIAFIRGLRPAAAPNAGQFLGRPDPQHALYLAAAVDRPGAGAGFAGRGADLFAQRHRPTGSTASRRETTQTITPRPSLSARLLRRSPSSSWAPTAAASSTPTPPIPSKTPPRCPISWRCCPSC